MQAEPQVVYPPVTRMRRHVNYLNLIFFSALYASVVYCFWQVNLRAVLLALLAFVILKFGITIGYHRLLTHRSFKTYRWVERTFAVMGALSMQRGPVWWVATHRMHHADTDHDGDPHSAGDGFFHSYFTWLIWEKADLQDPERLRRFSRDVAADPFMVFISRIEVIVAMSAALFALVYLTVDLPAALWVVSARIAMQNQSTFLVNSIGHRWGYRNFDTPDRSTNSLAMALISAGDGWHNNHHFDAEAAAHGRFAGEFDLTYQVILFASARVGVGCEKSQST